jgi:hypothetical protein
VGGTDGGGTDGDLAGSGTGHPRDPDAPTYQDGIDHPEGSVTLRARVGWPGEHPASYYATRVENGAMRCIECDAADVSERRERTTRGYRRFRCRA